MKLFSGHGKGRLWTLIAIAAACALPLVLFLSGSGNYTMLVACLILLYMIAVSGLDITYGYCGQISLGHAGFFAIGAYGSTLINTHLNIPVVPAMLLSAALAAIIGLIIAWPASKLVFHFLSLATIAFCEIIYVLISQSPGKITNDYIGLRPAQISIFGYALNDYYKMYFFGLACVIAFVLLKVLLVKSRYGRAFEAIRENAHAANGMGINVRWYKSVAFMVGAFYTGFAGAMYGHFVGFISPETFMFDQSIIFVTMLLFGGCASTAGPLVGVILVKMLNESLRFAQEYTTFLYGLFLLLVILFMPQGLLKTVGGFIKKRFSGGKEVGADAATR